MPSIGGSEHTNTWHAIDFKKEGVSLQQVNDLIRDVRDVDALIDERQSRGDFLKRINYLDVVFLGLGGYRNVDLA